MQLVCSDLVKLVRKLVKYNVYDVMIKIQKIGKLCLKMSFKHILNIYYLTKFITYGIDNTNLLPAINYVKGSLSSGRGVVSIVVTICKLTCEIYIYFILFLYAYVTLKINLVYYDFT